MALNEYLQRLQEASGEGSRATDFYLMKSKRAKDQTALIKRLQDEAARQIQFNAYADQGFQPGVNDQPASVANNNGGSFSGHLAMYPLKGNLRVSSPYGVKRAGHKSAHTGIDWADPAGTPIYAPADATVRSTLFDKIYGNQTILDLGGGRSVMLGHQSKFGNIKPGQHVAAGQLVGYVGSTGWSTGPHLHFETWVNNQPVNPLSWFR
jgi:murein DD-endopeptidase MepM/ murein hydrolase activator NlpD